MLPAPLVVLESGGFCAAFRVPMFFACVPLDLPGVYTTGPAPRRERRESQGADASRPLKRKRQVSTALQAYAALTTSAARGAVRDLKQLEK